MEFYGKSGKYKEWKTELLNKYVVEVFTNLRSWWIKEVMNGLKVTVIR